MKLSDIKNPQPVPIVGEYYHFWDDGKSGPSRHYICKVERIITPKQARETIIHGVMVNDDEVVNGDKSLYDIWTEEKSQCDWIFTDDTDYFLEVSCPNYDDNNLWFARTQWGGWFSFNIQSSWQSGELDVTGDWYKNIIADWMNEGWDITPYTRATYNKE